MRIILTPLGQDLITKLNEEKLSLYKTKLEEEKYKIFNKLRDPSETHGRRDNTTKSSYNSNFSGSNSNFNTKKYKNPHSLNYKTDLLNKLEMDQTMISVEELHDAKEILINQKKLNIPKNVTERYNSDKSSTASKIIPGGNFIKKSEGDLYDTGMTRSEIGMSTTHPARTKFTLKEILNGSSIKTLKQNYVENKRMKDKLSRINETNFRSVYENQHFIEKLEEKLNRKINPDRTNLIKYLNEKEHVSEVLISKIADYDEEKLNRINKICQIVLHNNERSDLFQDIIQDKLIAMKNIEKINYKSKIDKIGRNMDGFCSVLKNYDKKVNNKEKYRDIHNDMIKNYWNKYNVDRMNRRGNYKLNSNTSLNSSNNVTHQNNLAMNYNNSRIISTDTLGEILNS